MAAPTHTLPSIDFTKDPKTLEPGSQEWSKASSSLREVMEKYGGAIVKYDRISPELIDKMFILLPHLFALPVEIKCKNESPIPHERFVEPTPFYEAVGVHDSESLEGARAFTQLMWPDGNDDFCQTMNLLSTSLLELVRIVGRMVCDSYGAGSHYSLVERMGTLFRVSRYPAPSSTKEKHTHHGAHTDGSFLTILCQNDVDGLQFETREGDLFPVNLCKGSFVIFAGRLLQAWSNGRIVAVPHKVSRIRDKERLSCVLFIYPKGSFVLKAPEEFTDNGRLPLLSGKHLEAEE